MSKLPKYEVRNQRRWKGSNSGEEQEKKKKRSAYELKQFSNGVTNKKKIESNKLF